MLFQCSKSEKVSLVINGENFEVTDSARVNIVSNHKKFHMFLFLMPCEKSVFHSYHKIGILLNLIMYSGLIFLIIQNAKILTEKQNNLKPFMFIYTLLFLMFVNSCVLFDKIWRLDVMNFTTIYIILINFNFYIFFLILCLVFFICLQKYGDRHQNLEKIFNYLKCVFLALSFFACTTIFLFINMCIFINKINFWLLFVIFFVIYLGIMSFVGYKCTKLIVT